MRQKKGKKTRRHIREFLRRRALFAQIVLWVAIALVTFTLLVRMWSGRWWPFLAQGSGNLSITDVFDMVKIALTLIGGVGGVAFLVLKYEDGQRARREEERETGNDQLERAKFIDARLQTAIGQLGNDKSTVRIAGVQSLADIADETSLTQPEYRQRVVDILCGYLRSTDRGTVYERPADDSDTDASSGSDAQSGGDKVYYVDDRAVESTIFSIMRSHLGEGVTPENKITPRTWIGCSFDFHSATFTEDVDLGGCMFLGSVNFANAVFTRDAFFDNTAFDPRIAAAEKHRHLDGGFVSEAAVLFDSAVFRGTASFNGAILRHVIFDRAQFCSNVSFSWIKEEIIFDLVGFSHHGTRVFPEDQKLDRNGLPELAHWLD